MKTIIRNIITEVACALIGILIIVLLPTLLITITNILY